VASNADRRQPSRRDPDSRQENPDGSTNDYHVSEDIVDASIRMLRDQQQVSSGRPFWYLPFGAPHCPFHAPPEFIDHYAGRFEDGWDLHRQATYERQLEMGIIPKGTDLPPRSNAVPAWDSLDADAQRLYARLQETFCGFVDHTDAQIGRLMDALHEMGITDDTAVIFLSDNGASAEGGKHGTTNTERFRNMMFMEVDEMLDDIPHMGSRHTDPHYPIGWSQAGNAPF
jgi:arylsulfatase